MKKKCLQRYCGVIFALIPLIMIRERSILPPFRTLLKSITHIAARNSPQLPCLTFSAAYPRSQDAADLIHSTVHKEMQTPGIASIRTKHKKHPPPHWFWGRVWAPHETRDSWELYLFIYSFIHSCIYLFGQTTVTFSRDESNFSLGV